MESNAFKIFDERYGRLWERMEIEDATAALAAMAVALSELAESGVSRPLSELVQIFGDPSEEMAADMSSLDELLDVKQLLQGIRLLATYIPPEEIEGIDSYEQAA